MTVSARTGPLCLRLRSAAPGRQPDGARAPGLGARGPGHDQQDEPPGERSAPQLQRERRRAVTAAEDRLRPPGMEPSPRRARRDARARQQRQPSPSRSAAPRETAVMTAPACSTSSTTPAGMTPGPASGIVKFVQVSPVAPERTSLSVLAPSRLTMAAKSPVESRARGWPLTARLTLEALRSVRYTVLSTSRSGRLPAASTIASRFAYTCLLSAWRDEPTVSPWSGRNASWPETNTSPFATIAWEYGAP